MKKLDNFVNKSKKAILIGGASVLGLVLLVTGSAYATNKVAESKSIGAENAQNFAFADAGIDPSKATLLKTEFDRENGQFVYEVEFLSDNTEYEYYISADDGSVVKKEIDNNQITQAKLVEKNGVTTTEKAPATKAEKISEQEAKNIALKDAGLAEKDVRFEEVSLDVDDNILEYEVEFYHGNDEYDYEINAQNGQIISKSKEVEKIKEVIKEIPKDPTIEEEKTPVVKDTKEKKAETSKKEPVKAKDDTSTASKYISLEKAKSIALNHAGIDASSARFSKAKMDKDDGVMEYEIEFYVGNMEYEYEINAQNGNILDFDKELDD